VFVAFTGAWQDEKKEEVKARRLIHEYGADVLTYHQDDLTVPKVAEAEGVYFIGYNTVLENYSERNLATILCHWDIYYQEIIRRFLKGELNAVKNHWLGLDSEVVELTNFSKIIPWEARQYLAKLRRNLLRETLIFSGPLFDRKWQLRCPAGEAISDDVLLEKIDWQIDGVEIVD
ncbi:MAG: BMP family ABC transporter substrate-binding protein, partial [Desulfovibrio sp.]|nr:BMP family ABC transporter substrate-binding protein [Desulfovibrio sp.]